MSAAPTDPTARSAATEPTARPTLSEPTVRSALSEPNARPARREMDRFSGRRKKKPRQLAVILDGCTGCAGGPVCQICCPVDECMLLEATGDAFPFARIRVDPLKCVGCRKCVREGPDEAFLDGCPWDAIVMVPTRDWEEEHGELPY
jgi:ferredoxin